MMRYSQIVCALDDSSAFLQESEAEGELDKGMASCVAPPLLRAVLAACAPLAELSLRVESKPGKPL